MAVKDRYPVRREEERQTDLSRRESWMSPWTFSPFAFMRRFLEDMDRAVEPWGWGRGRGWQGWAPQVETFEREGNLIVRVDLPGLKKDEVDIEIRNDALILQGERKSEHEEERGGYFHSERSYGRFYRSIPLPEGVDPGKVTATFENGVLEVKMSAPQQTAEKQGRRVEIK